MIEIRQASVEDVAAVMALARTVPEAPEWTAAQYASLMGSASQCFVLAEEGGELLGFAAAEVVRLPDETFAQLDSIVVHSVRRRTGLGRRLLQTVMTFAAGRGAGWLELEVRAGNAAAISLYKSFGFIDQGVRRGYYQHPVEDAVLMMRWLGEAGIRD